EAAQPGGPARLRRASPGGASELRWTHHATTWARRAYNRGGMRRKAGIFVGAVSRWESSDSTILVAPRLDSTLFAMGGQPPRSRRNPGSILGTGPGRLQARDEFPHSLAP